MKLVVSISSYALHCCVLLESSTGWMSARQRLTTQQLPDSVGTGIARLTFSHIPHHDTWMCMVAQDQGWGT